ncbi:small acid-soluble spore protein P [Marinicrinis sediminis]|uniref:Small acid-soluble spore protein P n=1 Tax=Marinicrinis sediminis TaxID=1652465 RepID=A0ABW5RBK5_9BACL
MNDKMYTPPNPHELTNRHNAETVIGDGPLSGSKKTKTANHSRQNQQSSGSGHR